MFFVSGITGHVGGTAARQLLEEGYTVRALVRDPRKAAAWSQEGVDVRRGDFNDAAAVAAALEGVEGAYLMLPPFFTPAPGFAEAKAIVESFREALRRAPPRRLVALSSVGAHQPGGLGMITACRLLEEGLRDLPFPTAFVRPGSFLENYTRSLEAAAATGWFDSFLQPTDRPFPMIATEDIGREVARLLIGGWSGTKVVELGSPVSPDNLARAMGEALARPVRARAIPRAQWEASLAAQGMPPGFIRPFVEMEDAYNAGWIAFGVRGTESVAGTVTPAELFARARRA
ncbi:NmrA family NAD(P)-binding protein [Sorangium sp. So ce1078]|uniref:NmrA family NAD(P)-binding protein n=1 Tax=Sorangium sp. So ce1078 TaxID=3133329 RepID=UPI003F625CC8